MRTWPPTSPRTSLQWQHLSAGIGPRAWRFYSCARIQVSNRNPAVLATTGCWSAVATSLAGWPTTSATTPRRPSADLLAVAGQRWRIEEWFQAGKGHVGSTSTKSAAGTPGTAGPPWPRSPTPHSPSWPPSTRDTDTSTGLRSHHHLAQLAPTTSVSSPTTSCQRRGQPLHPRIYSGSSSVDVAIIGLVKSRFCRPMCQIQR
jgi:hypothetical protein